MISVSAEFRQALKDRSVAKVALSEFSHPDGFTRFWGGAGNLAWNGVSWIGIGDLGSVSEIADDDQIAVTDLVFTLAGIDPDRLSLLGTDLKGQTAKVWFACVRADLTVVPDPVPLRVARMDSVIQKIEDNLTASITLTCQADLWKADQPGRAAFTPEEQKVLYPDDTGFDLIHSESVGGWRR